MLSLADMEDTGFLVPGQNFESWSIFLFLLKKPACCLSILNLCKKINLLFIMNKQILVVSFSGLVEAFSVGSLESIFWRASVASFTE